MNGSNFVQSLPISLQVGNLDWQIEGVVTRYGTPARIDSAGNTAASAFNIGTLNGNGVFRDYVDGADRVDRYQFTLASSSSLSVLLGGLTADADLTLYDSQGNFILSSLNAGTATDAINTTLLAGTYYLVVELAGTQPTNYSLSLSSATATLPDLVGNLFDVVPEPLAPGNAFTVNFRVRNAGTSNAASFRTGFYLSTDATITTSDRFLGFQAIASLAAGITTSTLSATLALPDANDLFWRGSQTYYIGMVVDSLDTVGESNEVNNRSVGLALDYDDVQINVPVRSLVEISNLAFSRREGDAGTFRIRLTQAPSSNVTVTFNAGQFLTVDADGDIASGTQQSLTFTAANWSQFQTVRFIAENDASSSNRTSGNTIAYTLSGALTASGTYDLGEILNTYAPNLARYDIDLDYRNDILGFWTPARRTIAQRAANDWANLIANELSTLTLNNESIGQVGANGTYPFTFLTNRVIDDLVIFVGSYANDGNAGWGGPALFTSAANPLPRAGTFTINASQGSLWSDAILYVIIAHEIGHALGLLGLNYTGSQLVVNGYFTGAYSKAYYGGNVPMGLGGHPGNMVASLMSYGTQYQLSAPSEMDKRFLADSGYQVYGVNVANNSILPTTNTLSNPLSTQTITSAAAPLPKCGCMLCRLSTNLLESIENSAIVV
jgi:hypothetical protein